MYTNLLSELCLIHGPSGEEFRVTQYIIDYVNQNSQNWKVIPQIFSDESCPDSLILVFGKPRLMAIAHLDSVGFTVGYKKRLFPLGSPIIKEDDKLHGFSRMGSELKCKVKIFEDHEQNYAFSDSEIEPGTSLSFYPFFKDHGKMIESTFIDDRAGIYVLLKIAETLENGILTFSCGEEIRGGTAPALVRIAFERWGVGQCLVSDITWVTENIKAENGVVISLRDKFIPRRKFLDQILKLAEKTNIPYQLEIEDEGASDGASIAQSPYPMNWCFVGAPAEGVHSSREIIYKSDLENMIKMYSFLFGNM